MTDPYSVLGILPGADDETIKKAYRQAAKRSVVERLRTE